MQLTVDATDSQLHRVDSSLPKAEALQFADRFLPATTIESGRASPPRSHRWFQIPTGKVTREHYTHTSTGTIIELRGDGHFTMVPPSVHPSGANVVWNSFEVPATIEADVRSEDVRLIAVSVRVAKHYPADGGRHNVGLVLAGLLSHSEIDIDAASTVLVSIAELVSDFKLSDRLLELYTTCQKASLGKLVSMSFRSAFRSIYGRSLSSLASRPSR